MDPTGLGRLQAGVEPGGGDPSAGQVVDLVFHQGDQGGDDHGEAVEQERGQLVAEALAAPGREDGQGRPAGQERRDGTLLAGSEAIESEDLAEDSAGFDEAGTRRSTHRINLPDGVTAGLQDLGFSSKLCALGWAAALCSSRITDSSASRPSRALANPADSA